MNAALVRDIGCIFFLLGAGLVWAAFEPRWRLPACLAAAGFSVLHAVVHVVDTARGLVGPEHWMIDMSGAYIPAVLFVIVTVLVARSQQ